MRRKLLRFAARRSEQLEIRILLAAEVFSPPCLAEDYPVAETALVATSPTKVIGPIEPDTETAGIPDWFFAATSPLSSEGLLETNPADQSSHSINSPGGTSYVYRSELHRGTFTPALSSEIASNLRSDERVQTATYAKFDGIDGESTDADHKDWIEVLSLDHGYRQVFGGGLRDGQRATELSELTLVADFSKASPKLAETLLNGHVISTLDIEVTSSFGNSRATYLRYELKNVHVISYDLLPGPDGVLRDVFSVDFEEADVIYTERDDNGNSLGTTEYVYRSEVQGGTFTAGLASEIASNLRSNERIQGATYAKFDGIDGESKDADHKDWIEVLSLEHGYRQVFGNSGGLRSRSLELSELTLVTEFSKASPKLAEALLDGGVISTLDIDLTSSFGNSRATYLRYELKNVQVVSYDLLPGPGGVLRDVLSVDFEEADVTYLGGNDPLPSVTGVIVGDGTGQRSFVDQIGVEFSENVTGDVSAFELRRKSDELNIDLELQWIVDAAGTRAILAFVGPSVTPAGALLPGEYELRVNGDLLQSSSGERVDADGDGVAGGSLVFGDESVDGFFNFYGDTDGDGDVDGLDYTQFASSFLRSFGDPGYQLHFDWDQDGDVDGLDYVRFGENFLRTVS